MNRIISIFLAFTLLLSMSAFAESPENKTIIADKWINVRDGDIYILHEDGTGVYKEKDVEQDEGTVLSYTFQDGKLSVWVGVLALEPIVYTLVETPAISRLVAEDSSTYFVREANYAAIAEQAREENLKVLTSVEFWSARATVNYLSFFSNGGGWFLVYGATVPLSWEWVDNDTIKVTVDYNGKMSITLDIVNGKSGKQLVNSQTGAVAYVPK